MGFADFRLGETQSPCRKCGKWKKGCRNDCSVFAEFQKKIEGEREDRYKRSSVDNMIRSYEFDMKARQNKTKPTMISKINRQKKNGGAI